MELSVSQSAHTFLYKKFKFKESKEVKKFGRPSASLFKKFQNGIYL